MTRIAIAVFGVLASLASFFGFHSYKNIISTVQTNINKDIISSVDKEIRSEVSQKTTQFYDNLLTGTILSDIDRNASAVDRLMKCFIDGHYYDPAILVPLLKSLYHSDDWDHAEGVIKELKRNDLLYNQITDPYVYVLIGAIEIQGAPEHKDWLDEGIKDLRRGKSKFGANEPMTLSVIYINEWIYNLQVKNWSEAEKAINSLKLLNITHRPWRIVRHWKIFEDYFKEDLNSISKIKAMWDKLPTS